MRKLSKETEGEMDELWREISSDSQMLKNFSTNVIDEDVLVSCATSMTSQHYASLKSHMGRSDHVMMHWLGIPVEPVDPYQDGKMPF